MANEPYPSEYKVPKFQKFDGRRGKTREYFLNFMGAHAYDAISTLRILKIFNW